MVHSRQSVIDKTVYELNGNVLTHLSESNKVLSITSFITEKLAKEEFNRLTGNYRGNNKNVWRKRHCAKIYYNQLIIQL